MTRFHCINFDMQNSTHAIYSESRKKSPTAQMLLVSARSRNKELSLGTAALCQTIHESRQRTKRFTLYSIHPSIQCSGIEHYRSVFHIACITYSWASDTCYNICGYALDSHFPPLYFRSISTLQTTILAQNVRSLVSGGTGF